MDLKEIRQLIRFLSGTDVSEIEITEENQTVRINRAPAGSGNITYSVTPDQLPQPVYTQQAPPPAAAPAKSEPASQEKSSGPTINSPMVGTFYLAPSPESSQFVSEGDRVQKGQVVCIVEAMKLMNEIESEISGRVVRILKDNATPVEYGEPLFEIEVV
ncbi:MAG: acetyl-CoA carboxylase biotin carboxyl carrier protein [Magnetococcales bacterium]|nr:acetyl-CoA carboxylase biotin carboxyl carrier protein [Magnetococcales bacterium]